MSYFVFDMDETLAEMYPMYYFIASLRLKETIEEDSLEDAKVIPDTLNKALDKAYKCFVREVLFDETGKNPLGILRPGILPIMKQLAGLQSMGKLKNVVIYSNNGHLQSLKFIRDLIHTYLKTDTLIKECIHWDHPMREVEKSLEPGAANKTWSVLKNIMVQGNCKAPDTLEPENVYFFDDLDHENLQKALGENYYKVPAYTHMASFDELAEIWIQSLYEADINEKQYVKYLMDFFAENEYRLMRNPTLTDILIMFKNKTGEYDVDQEIPKEDKGIEMMKEAILKCLSRRGLRGGKRRQDNLTSIKEKKRRFTIRKIEKKKGT